jgi:hypothetical protein
VTEDEDTGLEITADVLAALQGLKDLQDAFVSGIHAIYEAISGLRSSGALAQLADVLSQLDEMFYQLGDALRRGEPVRWLGLIAAKEDAITSGEGECDKGTALGAMLDLAVLLQAGSLDHQEGNLGYNTVQKIADEVKRKGLIPVNEARRAKQLDGLIVRLRDELGSEPTRLLAIREAPP